MEKTNEEEEEKTSGLENEKFIVIIINKIQKK